MSALQDVLQNPRIGPQVLKIPPGLGKTTTLARAIRNRTAPPLKVLWFLREARQRAGSEESPVKEVLDLFPEAQVSAELIEGGQPRSRQATYVKERGWIPDHPRPQVRLLAHAYLPWLFGSDTLSWASSLTRGADLIVIDEDPLDTLVTTQEDLPVLLAWPALLELMQDSGLLQDGPVEIPVPIPAEKRGLSTSPSRRNNQQDPRLFPGQSRVQTDADHQRWMTDWAASLNPDPPSGSWTRFQKKLAEHLLAAAQEAAGTLDLPVYQRVNARHLIRRVTAELQRELKAIHKEQPATRRFGLVWTPGPIQEELVHLRFSLPRELQFRRRGSQGKKLIPVLVLDAYAHEQRYRQVLNAATRSALPGELFRLKMQTYTSAGQLNPLTLKQGAGRRHLVRLILEAVLSGLNDKGTLGRSMLLLAPGAVTGTLRQPKEGGTPQESEAFQSARMQAMKVVLPWLKEVFPAGSGEEVRFRPQHWFAGRGVNQFTGLDVVALTRPRTPKAAQDRLMAHLPQGTPEAEEEREQLWLYDHDVELLQMLNRGRQVHYRDNARKARKAPRVMTMFPLDASGEDKLHPLLQDHVCVLPQRVFSRQSRAPFQHRQLAGLTIPRGKLELTKLMTLAVVMELLHRPPVASLPPRWFPEEVLVVLGLLSPGPAIPSVMAEAFLSALKLEEANPAYRFTASALRHSAAGTGLWSQMHGEQVPWIAPGSVEYLVPEVMSALKGPLRVCLQRTRVKNVGLVWSLDMLDAPAIYAWSRSMQSKRSL